MSNPEQFEAFQEKFNSGDGYRFKQAFVNYSETVAEAQRATELQRNIDDVIEFVNSGQLPPDHMVITKGDARTPLWAVPEGYLRDEAKQSPKRYPEHGMMIYRPNTDGEYVLNGELTTGSSTQVFLGDRILKLEDNQLVIINSEHQVGITPSGEVDIINLLDDDPRRMAGKEYKKRFNFFLEVLDSVKDGANVYEDLSWG